jgi:hypothetical protein
MRLTIDRKDERCSGRLDRELGLTLHNKRGPKPCLLVKPSPENAFVRQRGVMQGRRSR